MAHLAGLGSRGSFTAGQHSHQSMACLAVNLCSLANLLQQVVVQARQLPLFSRRLPPPLAAVNRQRLLIGMGAAVGSYTASGSSWLLLSKGRT